MYLYFPLIFNYLILASNSILFSWALLIPTNQIKAICPFLADQSKRTGFWSLTVQNHKDRNGRYKFRHTAEHDGVLMYIRKTLPGDVTSRCAERTHQVSKKVKKDIFPDGLKLFQYIPLMPNYLLFTILLFEGKSISIQFSKHQIFYNLRKYLGISSQTTSRPIFHFGV